MKNAVLCLMFILAAAVLAPDIAIAAPAEPVANVVALRGTVTAKNAKGVERPLAIKNPIFQDDVLKTGATGRLQLLFTDNSIISLGGASEMKIAEYRWQPGQKDGALRTQIKEGTFRVMGGALTKEAPQNFKTETPTATIGIRGSMYAGTVTPSSLAVVFQGGKGIEITNPFGTVTITKPGFGTHVALNTAPAPPKKFTEQELGELNKQLNGKENDKGAPAPAEESGTTTTQQTTTQEGTTSGGEQTTTSASTTQETQTTTTATEPAPATETTTTVATAEPLPAPEPLPVLAPLATTITTVVEPVAIELPAVNELPSAPSFTTPPPPPSDGIYAFAGGLGGTSTSNDGSTNTISNALYMGVNWYNHKIFGVAFDETDKKEMPAFFFGTVSGSTVSDITIFGGGGSEGGDIGFIDGSGTGLFSGSAYDFFNFNATGNSYSVKTQDLLDSWTVSGGGQQVVGEMTPTAPRGTETWNGFVVAVSENMADPNNNRKLFLNADPSLFAFAIDKDAGTFDGALATDVNIGDGTITGINIGGLNNAERSVYIDDAHLGALLDGNVSGNALKTYGNYMVVDPKNQFSSYFTWGYWEAAYVESTIDRHIHVPYSMWLAGKTTPAQPPTAFTAEYTGGVRATLFDTSVTAPTPQATTLDGSLVLNVTLSSGSNTINANSYIKLSDNKQFDIATGAFASFPRFTSNISDGGGTPIAGTINGAFYGPTAEAVGGNFYASGGTKQYIGIFGGNR